MDICDVSVKVVQLGISKNEFLVQGLSDVNIPPDTVTGDTIKNPQVLADAIRKAISQPKFGGFSNPYVVASIPETKSFVRVIQMPAMTEEEAREAVPWEAEAYIPLPIGQVYLDWVILENNRSVFSPSVPAAQASEQEKAGVKMTVLIMASPKDYVDDLVRVLKLAKLKPVALEVESQATARSLIAGGKAESTLIVDIDSMRTSLIINDRGTLQFTSSLPVAGNSFTDSIAKALTLNVADAETMKREYGLGDDAKGKLIKKALAPVLNNLVGEIRNTIRFYEEHVESGKISRLLLAGGGSKLKHLPSYLADRFEMPDKSEMVLRSLPGMKIELGNPWVKVLEKGKAPPLSREDSLGYSTAIGLALRDLV